MKLRRISTAGVWIALAVFPTAGVTASRAAETNAETQLRQLQQQNEALQIQVRKQQEMIDALSRDVAEIRRANQQSAAMERNDEESDHTTGSFRPGKIQISGEGAVGIFHTGSQGQFPNTEFRVDEAKLFLDAPVWGSAFAFAEINLATRDNTFDVDLRLGEFYLDVEDISSLWGRERQLNLRAGRIDIPFGEEYITRDAIDNPLISHSLPDIWGVDEGIELYGAFGKFSYAAAIQNGGIPVTRDFDSDKSVAGRISFDPCPRVHLSVSGMRTGDLHASMDTLSEVWFGNGWFRSIGGPNTTTFFCNLFEADVIVRLPRGHLHAFGGYVFYDDNDPDADNRRDVYYYSIEAVHDLTRKLYAGARFSQIFADGGFPIVGNGNSDTYLFGPLAEQMWRLSLGLGYRWNRRLVLKVEYTFEEGKVLGGGTRNHENMVGAQAAFGF